MTTPCNPLPERVFVKVAADQKRLVLRCQRCGMELVKVGNGYQHTHDAIFEREIVARETK